MLRKHHGVMFLTAKCEAAMPRARQTFEKRLRPSTSSSFSRVFLKLNMGDFPSGQRGQTVNLLASPSVVRIHHLPPEKSTCESKCFFQLNPPFRVGEILLRNVKFSLHSSEIAAAEGGFNFTFCAAKYFTKSASL